MRTRFSKSRASVKVRAALFMADMAACISPSSDLELRATDQELSTLVRSSSATCRPNRVRPRQCSRCRVLARRSMLIRQSDPPLNPLSQLVDVAGGSEDQPTLFCAWLFFVPQSRGMREESMPLLFQATPDTIVFVVVLLSGQDRAYL